MVRETDSNEVLKKFVMAMEDEHCLAGIVGESGFHVSQEI
jgi:hypothetical protein